MAVDVVMRADIHQPVKAFAVDQRLQPGADHHIGRRFACFGIPNHANRMFCSGLRKIADIRLECQGLRLALPLDGEVHRHERRVIDGNPDLFDRRDKKIIVAVPAQNGREQTHQFLPANRCAKVKPRPVPRDAHVQIAAKRRVPQVYGWQAFALFRGLCCAGQCLCRRCHDILSAHCFCHFRAARYTHGI